MDILAVDGSEKTLIWNGYMRGGYATWPVGQECDLHCHQDAAEVFAFLDGACEMTVGEEVRTVGPGQTVYTGPGVLHKLKAVGDRPMVMFLIVAPNHEPTHTRHHPDGRIEHTNRPAPAPDDPTVIW